MSHNRFCIGVIAPIAIAITACSAFAPAPPPGTELQIQFVHYIQRGEPEQDVFIEFDKTTTPIGALSGQCTSGTLMDPNFVPPWMLPPPLWDPCKTLSDVVRVEPQDALRPTLFARQVYAAKQVVPHDPHRSGPNPLGPFPKGDALGLTWGEWLAARGSGSYALKDGYAELNLSFQKLIPHGTYSLWCGRASRSDEPFIEAPCGAADGSENQLCADENGNAILSFRLKPFPASTREEATILSLSYDRITPIAEGELGGYGLNNHVQLWFAFPGAPNALGPHARAKS